MIRISVIYLLLFCLLSFFSSAQAYEIFGGKFRTSFDIDLQSIGLKDAADNIYIGNFGSMGWGFGGNAALLYKISDNMRLGPNFNFTYGKLTTSWYDLAVFQPSIGPMLEMEFGENSVDIFLNYDLFGWLITDQTISSGSLSPAPAGTFNANIRGFVLGVKGRIPVNDSVVLGPYLVYGSQTIQSFAYKTLISGSYTTRWVNLDISTIQGGLSIYLDQLLPGEKKKS